MLLPVLLSVRLRVARLLGLLPGWRSLLLPSRLPLTEPERTRLAEEHSHS